MKILIGQNHLNTIGGSETYTYTLVEELVRRGHQVDVVCNDEGLVSEIMKERLNVKINDLSRKYDYCFISHNSIVERVLKEKIESEKIFQICHGTVPGLEQPHKNEKIRFISVSKEVHDHLLSKGKQSTIIYNGVNLERFTEKSCNKKLTSVFSLAQSEKLNELLEKVCKKNGIIFNSNNKFANPVFDIEKQIIKHDIIISLGRGTYESLSCGKNVIIADWRPYQEPLMDGFVTADNIEKYILKNCSGRTERKKITEESIFKELRKYDSEQGKKNRKFAEERLDIRKKVDQMLEL